MDRADEIARVYAKKGQLTALAHDIRQYAAEEVASAHRRWIEEGLRMAACIRDDEQEIDAQIHGGK